MNKGSKNQFGMNILIVDDIPSNIDILRGMLENEGCVIFATSVGSRVSEILSRSLPDLILLDAHLDGTDSFEISRQLKANPVTADIPIVFLLGQTSIEEIDNCYLSGGADYITKPFRQDEVLARTHNQLRIQELQREKKLLIKEISQKLGGKRIPGVLDKSLIQELYKWEAIRYQRIQVPFTLIMGHIDEWGDTFSRESPEVQEQLRVALGEKLNSHSRILDAIGQWNPERFFVLLPGTKLEGAVVVARKFQTILKNSLFQVGSQDMAVSMSFGLCQYPQGNGTEMEARLASTIEATEHQLDQAARTGKNQICFAPAPLG
ncbi:Putative Response regulator receiver modulated diguanylate cyclase [Nitrospina watsonii]|uniref:Response regulator receiver modulated diguanylate cyclase n=2 Tax=Nitrospina watsonii TaxID=1323948 RepID=A0ABM9HFI1_9BACT|nr:Putative Response regulator receiver modulated diguanylate cyclase [Nitrospina watsonii]